MRSLLSSKINFDPILISKKYYFHWYRCQYKAQESNHHHNFENPILESVGKRSGGTKVYGEENDLWAENYLVRKYFDEVFMTDQALDIVVLRS